MPRVTAVKPRAFATVQDPSYLPERILIAQSFAGAMADAVEADHPCTETESCDIACAAHNGFYLAAADILSGATETASVDAVAHAFAFNGMSEMAREAEVDADLAAWRAYFREHARMCDACGGATFTPDSECAHCGADFPEETDA